MFDSLRTAQHVLKTAEKDVQILSFGKDNRLLGRFTYGTRQSAIKALKRLTGREVTLKPMQVGASEKVETGADIEDIPANDE